MREWGPWDWAGFITLWLAVALSAIDQALKLLPELAQHVEPTATRARMWFRAALAFVPFGFLIIATLILIGRSTGILGGAAISINIALDKARLEVARIEPVPPSAANPSNGLYVNIYTINTGDSVLVGMAPNYRFEYPDRLLNKDEEERLMRTVLAGVPQPSPDGVEISPRQNGPWFTARDAKLTKEE